MRSFDLLTAAAEVVEQVVEFCCQWFETLWRWYDIHVMDKSTGDYNLIRQKVIAHDYLGIYTNIDIIMHANFEYIHEIDMSGAKGKQTCNYDHLHWCLWEMGGHGKLEPTEYFPIIAATHIKFNCFNFIPKTDKFQSFRPKWMGYLLMHNPLETK